MLGNSIRMRLRGRPLLGVVGCVTGVLILACGVAIVGLVFYLMRSSDVYEQAIEVVQSHPAAVRALGEPVESGFFVTGSISTSGASGRADFQIPVSGSRDKGTLYVVATKSEGAWHFSTLELVTKQYPDRIDLLSGQ